MTTKHMHESTNRSCASGTSKNRKRSLHSSFQLDREAKRRAKYRAELENLADYNAPPLSPRLRIHQNQEHKGYEACIKPLRRSITTRNANTSAAICLQRSETASTTKPKPKPTTEKSNSKQNRLLAELTQLQRWPGWVSEGEDSASESDHDSYCPPRTHSRCYPPKTPGTQNTTWSELPAEIRNMIYEHAMAAEEVKAIKLTHYPDGVPRRSVRGVSSATNFPHSYWGFTQTCRQVRCEFTPWLLRKRRIRTPLVSLNKCIKTFHRPGNDGGCLGSLQPFCCGTAFSGDGVEVLSLLKYNQQNPEFRLYTSLDLEAQESTFETHHFDELDVFRDMHETFSNWSHDAERVGCIDAIHLTSTLKEHEIDPEKNEDASGEDANGTRDILIKLNLNQNQVTNLLRGSALQSINSFIFKSKIAEKEGIRLCASVGNEVARWKVRRPGTVDMLWKVHRYRGEKAFKRLISAPNECSRYTELRLD